VEQTHNVRLPAEFREYLMLANGMKAGAMDERLVHFWSLDEIVEHLAEPRALERFPFLPFADYSIGCWVWAFAVHPGGEVAPSVSTYGPPLADCVNCFSDFLSAYLRGDDLGPRSLASRPRPHWKSELG
jgi:hypothetical protein